MKSHLWDIIIDDGSHIPEHQIRTFVHLFPYVSPGGLYILEDIETSYWPNSSTIYGQTFHGSGVLETYPGNAVKLFQDLVHIMNRKYYADIGNMKIRAASRCPRRGIPVMFSKMFHKHTEKDFEICR